MQKLFIVICLFSTILVQANPLVNHCINSSVTVTTENGTGSGTLFTRIDVGVTNQYVWTAAHVVSDCRKVRKVIDSTGSLKFVVNFDTVWVFQDIVSNGRIIGRSYSECDIIRYSDADYGHDLAVLKIKDSNFFNGGITFYEDKGIPEVGTKVWHVGSLLGDSGSSSFTEGVYSKIGRIHQGVYYDQVTCGILPGSSGGGVFLEDGRYVGMAVRSAGHPMHLIVPMRRIIEWALLVKIGYTLSNSIPFEPGGLIELPNEAPPIKDSNSKRGKANEEQNTDNTDKCPVIPDVFCR
jgi:S1-C subfamily serine protease